MYIGADGEVTWLSGKMKRGKKVSAGGGGGRSAIQHD